MDGLWRRLKPFQLLGLLACQLDRSGAITPMKGTKYLLIYMCWTTFMGGVYYSGMIHTMTANPDVSPWRVAFAQHDIYKSTTDKVALSLLILMGLLLGPATLIESFKLSRKLPRLWQSLLTRRGSSFEGNTKEEKISRKCVYWALR